MTSSSTIGLRARACMGGCWTAIAATWREEVPLGPLLRHAVTAAAGALLFDANRSRVVRVPSMIFTPDYTAAMRIGFGIRGDINEI
jgi:hypothetical protein